MYLHMESITTTQRSLPQFNIASKIALISVQCSIQVVINTTSKQYGEVIVFHMLVTIAVAAYQLFHSTQQQYQTMHSTKNNCNSRKRGDERKLHVQHLIIKRSESNSPQRWSTQNAEMTSKWSQAPYFSCYHASTKLQVNTSLLTSLTQQHDTLQGFLSLT